MIKVTQPLIDYIDANYKGQFAPVATNASAETLQCTYGNFTADLLARGKLSAKQYEDLAGKPAPIGGKKSMSTSSPSPDKVFSRGGEKSTGNYRVKNPSEGYSTKRYTAPNKYGQPVVEPLHGVECSTMSDRDKAYAGAWFKHMARKAGVWDGFLTEHEEELLTELCTEKAWCGMLNGEQADYIPGSRGVKALIDDSLSGGTSIVPFDWDLDVITFPLLSGELYPLCDLKPIDRGRIILGASIATPTINWGGYDATSMNLFSTSGMVDQLPSTVMAVTCAVEIGRDFLSDTPLNVGEELTRLIGERLAAELDRVIANGNGGTEPQGIFQASAVATTPTQNGLSGPPTLTDYISAHFALPKQYRTAQNKVVFISNDTTYARNRSIRVDPHSLDTSVNQQLVMGWPDVSRVGEYSTIGMPHKIQNDLANNLCGFGAMNKYRMYRRLGSEIRFEQAGYTLALANSVLVVFRARFAGRLMDSNAFVKWTNGQS